MNGAKFIKSTQGILLFLLALSLSSCFPSGRQKSEGHPKRIVSLVPSLTEIVYALGAESRLAGVTTFCDYPKDALTKPTVGDFLSPDPEKLEALKPDLILVTTPTQSQLAVSLKTMGYRVAVFRDPSSIKEMLEQIESLADTVGVHEKGKRLADSLRRELASIEKRETVSVYVEISSSPLITVGKTYITDGLEKIGLRNVFSEREGYPAIDQEEVIKRSPRVILLLYPGASRESVLSRIGWSGIPAVRERLVFDSLPLDEMMRPGPRFVGALVKTDSIVTHAH
ncbi:ABC transporter substrate-binding protein [bacterium]|nr:ABC transporter substrate-binding protein [bacterium]